MKQAIIVQKHPPWLHTMAPPAPPRPRSQDLERSPRSAPRHEHREPRAERHRDGGPPHIEVEIGAALGEEGAGPTLGWGRLGGCGVVMVLGFGRFCFKHHGLCVVSSVGELKLAKV